MASSKKLRVCVLFGGRSGEHEVSIVSAVSVMKALDPKKYEVIPVGISKEGRWIAGEKSVALLKSGIQGTPFYAMLPPDPTEQRLIPAEVPAKRTAEFERVTGEIDVVFPVLHGTYGEDGTVQGLLELTNLPYVGADVLGSAVCMDKIVQKLLCKEAGLPVVRFLWFTDADWNSEAAAPFPANSQHLQGLTQNEIISKVSREIGFPLFVKPPNLGSSLGITKAHDEKELRKGIEEALQYDSKVLIEVAAKKPREIEVSVLGNRSPRASLPGEVVPSNEFYDYDAKYVDGASDLIIPAKLSDELTASIRQTAIQAFLASSCEGMARVDFLLENDGTYFLNELNTIPGFTQISMYPKMWEASGLSYPELLDELIRLAIERHERKSRLKTSYQPKTDWYK